MMRLVVLSATVCLWISSSLYGVGRIWILPIDHRDGSGWVEEPTGGYPGTHGGRYWWASGKDGVRRAWWRFTGTQGTPFAATDPMIGNVTEEPSEERRLYLIDTWVPPANANVYSVIEVDSVWGIDPTIPWSGYQGVNRQFLSRYPSDQNNWVQAGLQPAAGPQAPLVLPGATYATCGAGRTGQTVWLKRGDWLYVKWDWDDPPNFTTGVSAIRITEFNGPVSPPCTEAGFGGQVDMGCMGNADPFYGVGLSPWWDAAESEPFVNAQAKMVGHGDNTLAAEGYRQPCTSLGMISPGLPANGIYTAQLAENPILFRLRYGGTSSLKWDAGASSGPFARDRVFTLNSTPGSEFVVGPYRKMHLLTVKNNGHNGRLNVELVYADATTDTVSVNLYEWFGSDGDATSIAVGVNGELRSSSSAVNGFRRLSSQGEPSNGGNHDGAFMFVHPVAINPEKTLSQVRLSASADQRGFSGWINVVAATMEPRLCNTPKLDADGDGDIDQADFGAFQTCITGGQPVSDYFCNCFDLVGALGIPDGKVDADDLQRFIECAGGPGIVVGSTPTCP